MTRDEPILSDDDDTMTRVPDAGSLTNAEAHRGAARGHDAVRVLEMTRAWARPC